ncbi:MAG: hypothetical protein AAFY81_03525, partial [Pseudomonadota bacterium]
MAHDDLEIGNHYFCREEMTGNCHGGIFNFQANEMTVELYAFDEIHIGVDLENVLILRLANNSMLSLHSNIRAAGTVAYVDIDNERQTTCLRVLSNVVIAGDSPWPHTKPIRRLSFSMEHSDELLRYSDKYDAIIEAELGDMPETTLFAVEADGMIFKAWYSVSGGLSLEPTHIGVRYGIDFLEPRYLHSYMPELQRLLHFVSAALGHPFTPSDIEFSCLTDEEYEAAVEARKGYKEHKAHYVWPANPPHHNLWISSSFAHVRGETELAAFLECLKAWISRDAAWRSANNLMISSLVLQDTLSGERLLNACRWLEEIPGADSEVAVSEEDIDAIAAVASAEAERLGHKNYESRIAGVIRGQLKKESNKERFTRLHRSICKSFRNGALNESAIEYFLKALEFRAKIAHGHFIPSDEAEHRLFEKSIYAMEALCYL